MSKNTSKEIKLVLDLDVVNTSYGSQLIPYLLNAGYSYEVTNQTIKNSISIIRYLECPTVDDTGQAISFRQEPFCIIVWDSDTLMPLIKQKQLLGILKEIYKTIPEVKILLALCGITTYFRNAKEQNDAKRFRKNNDDRPVNRQEFEWTLTELQILMGVDHRILNNADEFCNFIKQYTKSILEIPYKAERHAKDLLTDGCIIGDRMQCVSVSKGNGLARLYKQQLMQFTRITLEIAEAIISKYPTLKSLMEAYSQCNVREGMMLLSDIPVRRAMGPLAKTRNIGPEISKRVYKFYTSVDGKIDIDE